MVLDLRQLPFSLSLFKEHTSCFSSLSLHLHPLSFAFVSKEVAPHPITRAFHQDFAIQSIDRSATSVAFAIGGYNIIFHRMFECVQMSRAPIIGTDHMVCETSISAQTVHSSFLFFSFSTLRLCVLQKRISDIFSFLFPPTHFSRSTSKKPHPTHSLDAGTSSLYSLEVAAQ